MGVCKSILVPAGANANRAIDNLESDANPDDNKKEDESKHANETPPNVNTRSIPPPPPYEGLSRETMMTIPRYNGNWQDTFKVFLKPDRDPNWNKLIYFENKNLVVIYDGDPKAKFHLLVIPTKRKIQNVWQLLDGDITANIELMKEIVNLSQWIINGFCKMYDNKYRFIYGFHSIPTMTQLHCHIISIDFDSPSMKTQKCWNSFTTRFFTPAIYFLKFLQQEQLKMKNELILQTVHNDDDDDEFEIKTPKLNSNQCMDYNYYKSLTKTPLQCHKCLCKFGSMVDLKVHIALCNENTSKLFNDAVGLEVSSESDNIDLDASIKFGLTRTTILE